MKILLADDHRILIEGLTSLLSAHGFEVAGAAGDGEEALTLARALHPDLVLMDLRMPRCDGLTATRLIKAELPETKIVILTTSTEDQDLFESIKSGACGYLLKSVNSDDFIESLRGLDEGYPPFSPGLAAKLLDEFSRLSGPRAGEPGQPESTPGLSARQSQVLALAAQGFSYKEIGSKLNLSPRTVKYHMQEIIQRLHLENRAQALAFAARSGLSTDKITDGSADKITDKRMDQRIR